MGSDIAVGEFMKPSFLAFLLQTYGG